MRNGIGELQEKGKWQSGRLMRSISFQILSLTCSAPINVHCKGNLLMGNLNDSLFNIN